MRTAILTGPFPPDLSGVGDHACHIAKELTLLGHSTCVWAAKGSSERNQKNSSFEHRHLAQPWNRSQIEKLAHELNEWKPDLLLIEYTPQAMAPETLGVHLLFPFWIRKLRKSCKVPVVLFAHELYYPVEFSLRGILLGIPQWFQLLLLCKVSTWVYCSTDYFTSKLRAMSSWLGVKANRIRTLPIGSNILTHPELSSPEKIREFRKKNGILDHQKILLHFGGLHPTHLYNYVFETVFELKKKSTDPTRFKLVCVGVQKEAFGKTSNPLPDEIAHDTLFTGYLSDTEVSQWLYASQLVLAPFMDGISTRRSTVMAALSHGKAVLTNHGYGSQAETEWSKICWITPTDKREYIAQACKLLLGSSLPDIPSIFDTLGARAMKHYQTYFDWPVTTRALLELRNKQNLKKRVLHLYSGNLYGGIERVLSSIAQFQDFKQVEHEIGLCFEGRLSAELKDTPARLHLLSTEKGENPVSVRWSRPWTIRTIRNRLQALLDENYFDAAICHAPWALSIFGSLIHENHIPLYFWAHDYFRSEGWLEKLAQRVKPTQIICNSKFTEGSIKTHFPKIPTNVIYCPVPAPKKLDLIHRQASRKAVRSSLKISPDEFVILQVSRMERWKGQKILIQALGQMKNFPGWKALIVGGAQRKKETHYLKELQELALSLGIENRVLFLNERKDVPELLLSSDVFVQANLSPEPFGISFIEALYQGLPVISVNSGGPAETLNSETGILLEKPDPVLLAEAIQKVLKQTDRTRYQESGPARAKEISDPLQQIHKVSSLI